MIKFKESFAEQKVELLKKNRELVQEYKTKIEGDVQIVTSMNHDTKNEQAGIKRYGAKSTNAVLYKDIALKFFMGANSSLESSELRFTIDMITKSDAKTFGHVMEDFPIIETL